MELFRLEMESQAAARVRDGASAQGAGSRALGLESQATVEAQHLCCPSGTDRSFGDSGCVGSVEEERQRNEAVSGGFDGAGSCFLGSELRMGSRMDVAQADETIGGSESGGFMGSERQQDEVASEGGGGSGGADAASCFPGPELQAGSRADVAQADMTIDDGESGGLMRSEGRQGKMASEDDGGRPGGACCFLGPELRAGSQADVARAEGSAGGLEDVSNYASGDEWRWWYHRNRWFRFRQADGTTNGFQWPGLQIDVGELAIWAMGADSRAITKQEAALMVLRTMVMRARANGEGQR